MRVERAGYLAMRVLEDLGPVSIERAGPGPAPGRVDGHQADRARWTAIGLIERRPDPADGRSSSIALTAEGRRCMRDVEQERRRRIEALVSDWGGAEQAGLAVALTRLNSSLVESVAEPGKRPQCPRAV